jgi:hypothetical protein
MFLQGMEIRDDSFVRDIVTQDYRPRVFFSNMELTIAVPANMCYAMPVKCVD